MSSQPTLSTAASPSLRVARLMEGYLATQLLYVAVRLGIAEALADGPRTSAELAALVSADAAALHRILRGLAAEDLLEELPGGRFALSPLGDCLRDGTPGSRRNAILARGDLYYGAAAGLLTAVSKGTVAFEEAYGDPLFAYLNQHPDMGRAFQASMTDRVRQEVADVIAAFDFGRFQRLVDVGGGTGQLLKAILAAHPGLTGVLFDLPATIDQARPEIAGTAVAGRCELVAGDFFVELPAGGDAYLLSRVLHDWDDEAAAKILATCAKAMAGRGTLLVVDAVMPERAVESPAAVTMDLLMLMLLRGYERTSAEWDSLLTAAGFRLRRIVPTQSPVNLSVIEAIPLTP